MEWVLCYTADLVVEKGHRKLNFGRADVIYYHLRLPHLFPHINYHQNALGSNLEA